MNVSSSRELKGRSVISFPSDFVVIDIETTGLSPVYNEIIEVAALRVSDGEVTASFCEFIRPSSPLPRFVIDLTGITDNDLADARSASDVLPDYVRFISDSIVVGHNVNFDINFIYDYCETLGISFSNDFVDTMRLSRKLHPDQERHRLSDLSSLYCIDDSCSHRALADCFTTLSVFICLQDDILARFKTFDSFSAKFKSKSSRKLDISGIVPDATSFDEDHPLYGRVCVFTGKLDRMLRKDAAQLVLNLGGIVGDSVTKKTNYLILGNNDYCSTIKDGKSAKQKKAEKMISDGYDISIIPENVFYDLVFEE